LNRIYRGEPALWEVDSEPSGFTWLEGGDAENNVIAFVRVSRSGERVLVCVCNLSPVPRYGYRIGAPRAGLYRERFNSDAVEYGGSGVGNAGAVRSEPHPSHGHAQSLVLTIPPLATLVFAHEPESG
jgi:1,4-alpha-glucan branching enzyme